MANYQQQGQHQYRSPFGDTTYTKVFVGGLAWETPTDKMRAYFEQFGEILEAVIISDKNTGKSKGYGFVTFRDPGAAARACIDSNPMIDGRRANCNIASFGRPRPSPPRGRSQGGVAQGQSPSSSYSGMPTPQQTLPSPYFYHPYGYPTYPAYGYQGVYNPQVQQSQYYAAAQYYGGGGGGGGVGGGGSSSSSTLGGPYYYGYSLPSPTSRQGFGSSTAAAHRISAAPYVYYPTQQMEGNFTTTPILNPAPLPATAAASAAALPPSSTTTPTTTTSTTGETQAQQCSTQETDAVVVRTEGPSN